MHDPASELRRIPIPRTSVNRAYSPMLRTMLIATTPSTRSVKTAQTSHTINTGNGIVILLRLAFGFFPIAASFRSVVP
jgi:hypothetical protein